MPEALNMRQFLTLIDLLRYRALNQPKQLAFTFLQDGETETEQFTYQDLDRKARAIASYLQTNGFIGSRVLLLYPPGLEYIAAFFGCLYAGTVAVPAYPPRPNQSLSRLQAIAKDAESLIALTTTAILSNIQRNSSDLELKTLHWLATDNLDTNLADSWRPPIIENSTLAFLQYTSGSTGIPKGVMLSHGNLLHNSHRIQQCFEHTSHSRGVIWLPPYHDMGLIGGVLQPIYSGFPVTLMPPIAFLQRPLRWLQAISVTHATTSGGPNFAYDLCVSKITPEERATLDLSSWDVAFNGAEPIRESTLERFARTFADCGFRPEAFYPCYGLAEGTLLVTGGKKTEVPTVKTFQSSQLEKNRVVETPQQSKDDVRTLVGCGRNQLNQKIFIVNPETLTECKASEVGEIWVSSPSVAAGYWNQKEVTKQVFQVCLHGEEAFLRTGDLGFLHAGELFITGRLKDLIIIRGRNHYPQDIELTVEKSHLALQPQSGGAFSIDVAGEERLVVVQEVKRSYLRNLNAEEIIQTIRQAIAKNHELQVYGILLLKPGSIPKTSSGKIQRHACCHGFLNNSLNTVTSSILESSNLSESLETLNQEQLLAVEPINRPLLLESYVQQQVAQVLKVAPSTLNTHQPLTTFGVDSLMAMELKNAIETDMGVILPITSFLQGDSITELTKIVLTQLSVETEDTKIKKLPPSPHSPLSYSQRTLWFLHQIAPNSSAYNIAHPVVIKANLHVLALRRAFEKLVVRHSALRTTFKAFQGEPVQLVHEQMNLCWSHQDASNWDEEFLRVRLTEEANRPFDLERGPLMRVSLFTRSQTEHVLLLTLHHIVTDFWSMAVLVKDLGVLYEAENYNTPAMAPLTLQYSDYCHNQIKMLSSEALEQDWAYWQQQLAGELPVLNLSTDRPRPLVQTYNGATVGHKLSVELTSRLKILSRLHGTTLYMTLLAAFQVLLHRYTGQSDILVGSPTTGRNKAELTNLVGYFVNPVVLRANLSGSPNFADFLTQTRQTVCDAFKHQDYPLALIVERLQPLRDLSRSPLFQVMFTLEKNDLQGLEGLAPLILGESGKPMTLGELSVESYPLQQHIAQFDLALRMLEIDGSLTASLEYNTDLFDVGSIQRMLGHLETLLEGVVNNPQQSISTLPLLTASEKQTLLVWNQNQAGYPQHQCIHQLFEAQVELTPDAVAVVFEEQLSYQELNSQANKLAHYLQKLGVAPNTPVGICVERSLAMVIGVLGILKAGGAYLPLDPTYPQERLAFMLEDTEASILLTQQRLVESLPACSAQIVCLDGEWDVIAKESDTQTQSAVTPEDLIYIIYTSGSTGKPKGVMTPHRAVSNHLHWMQTTFPLTGNDRILQKHSFSFDVSVWELFGPLLAGAQLILAKPKGHLDTDYLVQVIAQHQITFIDLMPSMLQILLEDRRFQNCSSLKRVTCGSEAIPTELPQRFFELMDAELYNIYGPTEATIGSTYWNCARYSEYQNVPIGRPIANTQIYILDSHLQPVPVGIPGEIYIGGTCLALGYLNRPELTQEKFIDNPFCNSKVKSQKSKLYKTGDLAKYLLDGNIEFIGRVDDQVKLRGFRIELGEIETALRQYPYIQEAVVILRDDLQERLQEEAKCLLKLGQEKANRLISDIENMKDDEVELMLSQQKNKILHRQLPEFEVSLQIKDSEFINPKNANQRNWLLQRSLDEVTDDLIYLDQISKRFVAGSQRIEMEKRWSQSQATYDDSQLIIQGQQVMQDWERPLMREMAKIVTETHGNVLEVGFGMAISATYIQEFGANSYTVIECNDEVIKNFHNWKKQYPDKDIRLIYGKWQDVTNQLGKYDGVFFDTYPTSEAEFYESVINSITFAETFFPVAANCLNPGGIFTYYTNEIDSFSRRHQRLVLKYFSSFTISVVKPLFPPEDCNYWWADSMVAIKAIK
jgi:amino acid adenylation domain-containing protein